jgi:succinylglutamate desuccinylase
MAEPNRVICRYDGAEKGPLLICLGGVHGNEPAGVQAIHIIATLLDAEPAINPGFVFKGRMVGISGNVQAISRGQRFIQADLNRSFKRDHVEMLLRQPRENLQNEAREVYDIVTAVNAEIEDYNPDKIVVLDIHSTSAHGGIFVIASQDAESIRIGKELHAPVILDFVQEVNGTTLGYFTRDNYHREICTVVFECGQHEEPLSVNRAIAAIINCMRTIGCVSSDAVENKHDQLLHEFSQGLPKVARLVERYGIPQDGAFRMSRQYQNFEAVSAGEIVGFLEREPVKASHAGLILLPRLQDQGDDGYFIVTPVVM